MQICKAQIVQTRGPIVNNMCKDIATYCTITWQHIEPLPGIIEHELKVYQTGTEPTPVGIENRPIVRTDNKFAIVLVDLVDCDPMWQLR